MKILLINPVPGHGIDCFASQLPLGIASIAAVANKANCQIHVINGTKWLDQTYDYLKNSLPDIVGIQSFINNTAYCYEIAQIIKSASPKCLVVVGGVQASNFPHDFMKNEYIDCVVPGEGELTFEKILHTRNRDFSQIPGLFWKDVTGVVHHNKGLLFPSILDELPFIPYELFYEKNRCRIGHILTHRGCPHHCGHCPLRFRAGVTIRTHSVERITRIITHLIENFGIESIEFYDENFTMHRDVLSDLCDWLKQKKIPWTCTARISQMDKDIAYKMAESGCEAITFGIGTGVPRLQKLLGTNEDLEKAHYITGYLHQYGVKTIIAFSVGNPTESIKEFWETIRYGWKLNASVIRFEPSAPLPGTLLYEQARSGGRFLIQSWEEYTKPGQLIYLPQGWRLFTFKFSIFLSKIIARLHRILHR